MKAIYKRELRSYFSGFTGYLFVAFMLLVVGVYSAVINFAGGYSSFEYVLGSVGFVFLLNVPILSMRVFAEERRQKTDQLLYTLPLGMTEIVLGKYFAMLTVLLVPTAVFCIYPLVLSLYGTVSFLTVYSAIVGFFLLGAALISIGMFISSLTENQIVSAVLTFVAVLFCYLLSGLSAYLPSSSYSSFVGLAVCVLLLGLIIYLMTRNAWVSAATVILGEGALLSAYLINSIMFEGLFQKIASSLSVYDRLTIFIDGIFDITSVMFYLSMMGLFVFFTVQSLEKRRWS